MKNKRNQAQLLDSLAAYSQSDFYPFHMPGHKRTGLPFPNPWSIDITEIEGFDNLHHAKGILMEAQMQAARLFGAEESFFLVNGSTCGLLSAVSGCVNRGGKLLMSRNCHKSVYHAVLLRQITPVYLMPETTDFGICGSLNPQKVQAALEHDPGIEAVLVVSPTYDGVVSDIKSIADIVHRYHIPLIVDEAHGAHLPFSARFPASALQCGADVVVQSLHKTLPAFTQTALLHIGRSFSDCGRIRSFLEIYQSSSPSYLLMASMQQCLTILEQKGTELFAAFTKNLDAFYDSCHSLQRLWVLPRSDGQTMDCFDRDFSKILISGARAGLSGQTLSSLLRNRFHLELEMASGHYALALTSLLDRPEGFDRLSHALFHLDQDSSLVNRDAETDIKGSRIIYQIPERRMNIHEAMERPERPVPLDTSLGMTSREFVYLYPPGIPLLTPGEVIGQSFLDNRKHIKNTGLQIEGMIDTSNERIMIVNS